MSHNNHVIDGVNKDVGIYGLEAAKDYYLSLCDGWKPYNPDPVVRVYEGVRVVRDDLIVGTKARAGDLLAFKSNADTFVYCQPRTGLAGVSILDVAKHYNKKVILFMPSSKRVSLHQACCIERGAEVHFHRIAAMPILNMKAKKYAEENGYYFVPLGLRHELATAGIIHTASMIDEPDEVYVATSTGVLSRALQIAWPNAKFHAVAVARNMKAGELGRASVISHPYPFTKPEDEIYRPPFPTVDTYDAKVWRFINKDEAKHKNILFWNVGREPELEDETIYDRIESYRNWDKKEKTSSSLYT